MCLWVAGKGEMTEQGSHNPKAIFDPLHGGEKRDAWDPVGYGVCSWKTSKMRGRSDDLFQPESTALYESFQRRFLNMNGTMLKGF